MNIFTQAFLFLYWGQVTPDALREILGPFKGKLPRNTRHLQSMTGHLKRQASWAGKHGAQGKGLFYG